MQPRRHSQVVHGRSAPVTVSDKSHVWSYVSQLSRLYHATLLAGEHAARYWADISVNSKHLLAPLASIPGVAATLWTPETMSGIKSAFDRSTRAGQQAAQYWADISVHSKHPLAPLAAIPGAFAALWTPETAPSTAITLGTAIYGFGGLPGRLTHFTTTAGAEGIATSGAINASRGLGGMFGPGVYMARVGRPVNLFIRAASRTPILLNTPSGTARIVPYLVYVRWGTAPLIVP
jgi:hypothetical protein